MAYRAHVIISVKRESLFQVCMSSVECLRATMEVHYNIDYTKTTKLTQGLELPHHSITLLMRRSYHCLGESLRHSQQSKVPFLPFV